MGADFVRAIAVADVAPGGMRAVDLNGREVVVCNRDGIFQAIDRRCGHMNAPLEKGTLDGAIVTCPMHCAQFDIRTGEVLSGPVPAHPTGEPVPPRLAESLGIIGVLVNSVRTLPIGIFEVKVESGWVWVRVPAGG